MSRLQLDDLVGLSAEEQGELIAALADHTSLHVVIQWGLAQSPPCSVDGVVVQDEYTHDVVMPWRDGRVLVYDTT